MMMRVVLASWLTVTGWLLGGAACVEATEFARVLTPIEWTSARPAEAERTQRLTVVFLPALDWRQLERLHERLPLQGGWATRTTGGPRTTVNSYASLASAAPATFFAASDQTADTASLVAMNAHRSPQPRPGLIAERLKALQGSTAFLSTPASAQRPWARWLAADAQGQTSHEYDVDNWQALLERWRSLPTDVRFVVIDAVALIRPATAPEQLAQLFAVAQGGNGEGDGPAGPGQEIWLLALPLEPFAYVGRWVAAGGAAHEKAGFRTFVSASTRRLGLLALTDLVPDWLFRLTGETIAALPGRPLYSIDVADQARFFASSRDRQRLIAANQLQRLPLIRMYVYCFLCGLVLSVALRRFEWGRRAFRTLMPLLAAVPALFLILPWFGVLSLRMRIFMIVAMLLCVALALQRFRNWRCGLLAIAVASLGLLWFDQARGALNVVGSPLGHSLIAGARFYGIGNEYAGMMIGAALVGAGLAYDACSSGRFRCYCRLGVAVWTFLNAGMILSPDLGANFGNGLALSLAGALIVWLLRPQRTAPAYVWIGGGFLIVLALTAVSVLLPGPASHMGVLAARMADGDWYAAVEIARRKVLLNLSLFRYTIWSYVLVGCLAAVVVFVLNPGSGFRQTRRRAPGLYAAIVASLAGALFTLVLNDSGVVAAATALIFPTIALVMALLTSFDARVEQ